MPKLTDGAKEAGAGLSLRTKLGFGIGDLGGNLFFTAMGFWSLNYLTDTAGLAAAAAGAAVMVGKIWDAVTDPMMGFISDRTKSRWGRRRPYFLFGAFPLLLAMWWFFSAPPFKSTLGGAVWAAIALCALNTAYTVVNIPYGALTPELTKDYHERTSLNGFRFGFAVVGTILGAAAVQPIVGLFGGDKRAGFSAVGLVMGAVMASTILVTFLSVREPANASEEAPTERFFPTFLAVFKNRPYVILLAVYACNLTGITFVQGILVYYFKYVYGAESMTTLAMILLLVTAMACVPLSVLAAKRFGKKRTYQFALLVIAVACMAIFFLGHRLGPNFTLAVMVFAGVGIGFGYVPPFAMLPDAIELDAARTGKRKEGAFYGMWTFTSKLGVSLATVLSGLILGIAGYVPDAAQGAGSILAIRLLLGPIPAAVLLLGILVVERYPIDEAAYAAIMEEERNRAEAGRAEAGSGGATP
ncbi:MAG: MFS transporter [Spirochaetaceae bacterium]|nr:MFS transporter [Spirochaetaceae bacterium]